MKVSKNLSITLLESKLSMDNYHSLTITVNRDSVIDHWSLISNHPPPWSFYITFYILLFLCKDFFSLLDTKLVISEGSIILFVEVSGHSKSLGCSEMSPDQGMHMWTSQQVVIKLLAKTIFIFQFQRKPFQVHLPISDKGLVFHIGVKISSVNIKPL